MSYSPEGVTTSSGSAFESNTDSKGVTTYGYGPPPRRDCAPRRHVGPRPRARRERRRSGTVRSGDPPGADGEHHHPTHGGARAPASLSHHKRESKERQHLSPRARRDRAADDVALAPERSVG